MKYHFTVVVIATFLSMLVFANSEAKNNEKHHNLIDQKELKRFAEGLVVRYQVVDNRLDKQCLPERAGGACFRSRLTLSSDHEMEDKNWSMYFSHMSPIQRVESEVFSIRHINGDLHQLTPGKAFTGFKTGKNLSVEFRSDYWHLSESDIMPNYYLVSGNLSPEIIASTRPRINSDTGLEKLPHVGDFTHVDRHFKRSINDNTELATSAHFYNSISTYKVERSALATTIVPTPWNIKIGVGNLSLARGVMLAGDVPPRKTIRPALDELKKLGVPESTQGVRLLFRYQAQPGETQDWYRLDITDRDIVIVYKHAKGASYALRSLSGLLFVNSAVVPKVSIEDRPRFAFRGMHIDVARNFRDKNYIIRLLEQMARYKLNALHLHLADDEGWRLEIPGLPELTDIGSRRCHNLKEDTCLLPQLGSGPFHDVSDKHYFSVEDYQEILRAANARHIEVIPSFDMPGHSRAAVKSMEARYQKYLSKNLRIEAEKYRLIDPKDTTKYRSIQYYNDNTMNVCLSSSYRFVEKIIDSVIDIHSHSGVPLKRYHIGADETAGAWVESPACQHMITPSENNEHNVHRLNGMFIEKVSALLAARNIIPAGWSDGMSNTRTDAMPPIVQSNAWTPLFWDGHISAHEQANRGWQVIVSSPDTTYFDFPYSAHPQERGYYWASRSTSTEKVYKFMPENLPANAEVLFDRENNPYTSDDQKSHLKSNVKLFGVQGNLWTETIRTDDQADYMIFPRLIALAERAWHRAEWEPHYHYQGKRYASTTDVMPKESLALRDAKWNKFANWLARKELLKLDDYGVNYRVAPPGAKVVDGKLHMKSVFPGTELQYRVNESEWQTYRNPVAVSGRISVRARSADGQRAGRSQVLYE